MPTVHLLSLRLNAAMARLIRARPVILRDLSLLMEREISAEMVELIISVPTAVMESCRKEQVRNVTSMIRMIL
jgi:hypothetical protein